MQVFDVERWTPRECGRRNWIWWRCVCVCVFVREEGAGEGASVGGAIMEIEIRFTRLVCLGAGAQINYRRTFPSPRVPAAVGMYSSPTY